MSADVETRIRRVRAELVKGGMSSATFAQSFDPRDRVLAGLLVRGEPHQTTPEHVERVISRAEKTLGLGQHAPDYHLGPGGAPVYATRRVRTAALNLRSGGAA